MRLAKPSRNVLLTLAMLGLLGPGAVAQANKQPAKTQAAPPQPAKTAPTKAQAPKAEAPKAQPSKAQPAKSAPVAQTAMPGSRRRDPFEPLIQARPRGAGPVEETSECKNRAPGKPGLVISQIQLSGVVQMQSGMIAVVGTRENRVYFLREGDRLCNGDVERITLEGVAFRERGRDAFNNPLERVVMKRLYPSAGEQR